MDSIVQGKCHPPAFIVIALAIEEHFPTCYDANIFDKLTPESKLSLWLSSQDRPSPVKRFTGCSGFPRSETLEQSICQLFSFILHLWHALDHFQFHQLSHVKKREPRQMEIRRHLARFIHDSAYTHFCFIFKCVYIAAIRLNFFKSIIRFNCLSTWSLYSINVK